MSSFGRNTTGKEVVERFLGCLDGKTVLITGPSISSIRGETAISLAYGNPAQILLAGRTELRALAVIQKINELNSKVITRFIYVDLASQKSIHEAAEEINASVQKIDYLINNAGVIAVPTFQTTEEGIELQFGSNHIGHFLLTNLLIGKILTAGKGARIVNIASTGFDWNFKDGAEYSPWHAYAQSKTGNVLFTVALAEKLKTRGIQSFAVQPGLIPDSNLATHITPDSWIDVLNLASKNSGGKLN